MGSTWAFCTLLPKNYFSIFFIPRGDVEFVQEESWHPWSWQLCVLVWCFLEQRSHFFHAVLQMHVPSRSRLTKLFSKHQVFFYILALRTNCPVGPSITKLSFSLSIPGVVCSSPLSRQHRCQSSCIKKKKIVFLL